MSTLNTLLSLITGKLPNVMVETGTHLGASTRIFSELFKDVYTIELSDQLIKLAKEINHDKLNIKYYHGKSHILLSEIVSNIHEDYVIFLDAHGSGGDTTFDEDIGRLGSPVLLELEAVKDNKPKIIIIDDLRDFKEISTYPSVQSIKDKLKDMGYNDIYIVNYAKGWLVAEL